jgi:hypothetical protein
MARSRNSFPNQVTQAAAAAVEGWHATRDAVVSMFSREFDAEHQRMREVAEAAGIAPFEHPHLDLARAFAAGRLRLAAEREWLWLGKVLTDAKDSDRQSDRKKRLRQRQALLKEQFGPDEDAAPVASADGLPDEVIRALAIVRGDMEPPPKPLSAEARLAALDEKIADIEAGERSIAELVEEQRSAASLEAAKRLRKTHEDSLLRVYRSAQAFIAACDLERLIRSAHQHAGFLPRPDILPPPSVRGVAIQLGSESSWEALISQFRRELEGRGLLG